MLLRAFNSTVSSYFGQSGISCATFASKPATLRALASFSAAYAKPRPTPTQRSSLHSPCFSRFRVQDSGRCSFAHHLTTGASASLPPTMAYLRHLETGCEIFLVGTAHISRKSAEEVKEVIRQVQPETVFVELCDKRAWKLMAGEPVQGSKALMDILPGSIALQMPGIREAMELFYRALGALGFDPGLEFKVCHHHSYCTLEV
ncbi:hypothetical protein CYMTET_43722 [Cymbomonas tetramitiformis]|uniref:TraB domain-containing protein n=1 Tax=Cymbomonas tetramitiformis TaxID=36881 RepID=A0AAE0F1D4_9CHLO|nr:hypothetical protein CYMTET_43722 [Cymbomonas tetramitiformis]